MTEDKYLDPKEFYSEELEDWTCYWDNAKSLYENLYSLTSQAVILPYHSVQMPVAVVYMMTSSKWSKVLPILFSWGEKGSGKTTFALIANRLHGFKFLFSPADTFASIRNSLNAMRWYDPDSTELEKDGAILCWDNLHKRVLEADLRLYQTMLFGYNKSTERILIAGSEGANQNFHVFCPKVISSVEPLHSFRELDELSRRLLVIRHKPLEKFKEAELENIPELMGNFQPIDLDSINWKGFEDNFYLFWSDEENCRAYVKFRGILTRKRKVPIELPPSITSARWTISVDLIATGLLLGAWKTPKEAIDHLGRYWKLSSEFGELEKLNTIRVLKEYLDSELKGLRDANERLIGAGLTPEPIHIATQKVKKYLEVKSSEGAIDIAMKTKNIAEVMRGLGFRLKGNLYVEEDE
jgi:hypothetical protein